MTLLTLFKLALFQLSVFQPLLKRATQSLTQRVTNRISLNRQLKTLALCIGLLLPFLSTSVQAQGQTTFIPIAVGDILIFIPLLSTPTQTSVKATSSDGRYQLKWDKVPQASYYQIIITDEKGKQRIVIVTGNSHALAGLSLGNNTVEIQACNSKDQCGASALVGTVKRNTKVTYQHTDMLGSPVMQSDEAGNVVSRSVYDPFGKRLGGDKEGIGYTGHLHDKDLGLTYMQARYYDPLIARFYSNDPVGFADSSHSFNRYAYANNNPYKYVDPDGEWGVHTAIMGAVAGAIGGATTGYYQNGLSGALEGAGIGAIAGGAVGYAAPPQLGLFATNTLASIAGQMMSNKYHGAAVTDNLSISAAVGAGLGGLATTSLKGLAVAGPKFRPDVIGNLLSTNTQPSKIIGSSIIAVAEGIGAAFGETAGKEWGELAQKMVTEIRAPQVQQVTSE